MQSSERFGSGVDGEVEGLATDFVWRCLPSQSGSMADDAEEQEEGSRCPSEEKTAPCGGREQQESIYVCRVHSGMDSFLLPSPLSPERPASDELHTSWPGPPVRGFVQEGRSSKQQRR